MTKEENEALQGWIKGPRKTVHRCNVKSNDCKVFVTQYSEASAQNMGQCCGPISLSNISKILRSRFVAAGYQEYAVRRKNEVRDIKPMGTRSLRIAGISCYRAMHRGEEHINRLTEFACHSKATQERYYAYEELSRHHIQARQDLDKARGVTSDKQCIEWVKLVSIINYCIFLKWFTCI